MSTDVIDSEACAELLGCSAAQVDELARTGEIPGLKIGRSWRFVRADLLAYLAEKARAEQEQRRSRAGTPTEPVKPRRRAPPALSWVRPA